MLNVMRDNLRHLKWLLIVVAVAMVGYLGQYFFTDSSPERSGDWAAKVGEETVSARSFLNAARNVDAYYRSLLGDQYEQLKPSLRLGTQSIQRLVDDEIILQEADRLGLIASDVEVAEAVHSDPALQDGSGNFIGAERYKEVLQRAYPGGVEAYETNLASSIVRAKWEDLMTATVQISDREIEDAYRQRNERTAVRYAVIPSSEQSPSSDISDDELRSWFEEHSEDYLRSEGRRIRYVLVERQAQMDQIEITDEDVASYYEANQAAYTRPEQRRASHILLRIDPDASEEDRALYRKQAENLLSRARAGEDFAELARANSQDPGSAENGGDLGFFARGRMVPEFSEAVFSTPVGEFADVVESQFGFHVIKVTGERPAGVTPLEEVQEGIRRELKLRRAQERMREEADRIRALVTSPEDLLTVAEAEGLETAERLVTADDRVPDLAPSPDFLDSVRVAQAGDVLGPLGVARGLAIVAVDEVVPESLPPLEDVEGEVRSAILNERARQAALEAGRRALDRNSSLDAAARAVGAEPQESGDLAPGKIVLPGTGGDSPALRDALFGDGVEEGARGVVPVPAGAVIYEVTRRVGVDLDSLEANRDLMRRELIEGKRNALVQSILNRLRDSYEVTINEQLVNSVNG